MVVEILVTDTFEKNLSRLTPPMKKIALEKIRLLSDNPRHPSLNVHQLQQIRANIWDCYITEKMRLLYELKDGLLHLWDIGGHAIVDKVHIRSFAAHTRFKHMEPQSDALPPPSDVAQREPEKIVYSPALPFYKTTAPVPTKEQLTGTYNHFRHFQDAHLRILGVPTHLVRVVRNVPSLETVLALPGLPTRTRTWLEELSTSPDLEAVFTDSSLLLYRTNIERLEGYCEGKIKRLMLNLQRPEQQQYVDMERAPITLLKGAAGSGKTTVGIYRAIRLAEQGRRVLLVTYSKTLASVTKSLVEELIGPLPPELRVTHLHSLMMSLLRQRSFVLHMDAPERPQTSKLLEDALNEVRRRKTAQVLQRDKEFFLEEIKRVIKGLGLRTVEEYKAVERYGRKTALNGKQREAVWDVYELYQKKLAQARMHDWSDVALLALQTLQESPPGNPFDDIIVDEAQDLTPVELRVIQHLVTPVKDEVTRSSSIMILADAAQTLYSRGFSWKQAGIQARGRTAILRKNFRNTRQIAEAAAHLLEQNTLLRSANEYVDPEWTQRQGSPPIVMKAINRYNQIEMVRDRILDLVSDQTFRLSDFAVLCPTNELCTQCKQTFETAGLRTVYHKDDDFDLLEERIKILTIHSAKGLEFPVVFLIGLVSGILPSTRGLQHVDAEEAELFIEQQRTLCYVGMTRAAEALYLLTVKNIESRFVQELDGKVSNW